MKKLPASGLFFLADIIDRNFKISFITYIEYIEFKDVSDTGEQFIKLASVIEVDKDIIDTCVELRKENAIKLPDAIIAATALSRKLVIVTRNISDFKGINNLEVLNPREI